MSNSNIYNTVLLSKEHIQGILSSDNHIQILCFQTLLYHKDTPFPGKEWP